MDEPAGKDPSEDDSDHRDPLEVIELGSGDFEVRSLDVTAGGQQEDGDPANPVAGAESRARNVGGFAASLGIRAIQRGTDAGRNFARRVADTPAARVASDLAAGARDAIVDDVDWEEGGRVAKEQLGRVISEVAPVVANSLDPAELVAQIDVNTFLDAVDVDALLERVDVNAILERVDVNTLLAEVDIMALVGAADLNAVVASVDVDALLSRVDLSAAVERVDLDAALAQVNIDDLVGRMDLDSILETVDIDTLLQRIDVDALLARVDVGAMAKRARVGELVAEATSDVGRSALDVGRRQGVALDTLLMGVVNRILGRHAEALPQGPALLTREEE